MHCHLRLFGQGGFVLTPFWIHGLLLRLRLLQWHEQQQLDQVIKLVVFLNVFDHVIELIASNGHLPVRLVPVFHIQPIRRRIARFGQQGEFDVAEGGCFLLERAEQFGAEAAPLALRVNRYGVQIVFVVLCFLWGSSGADYG